MREKVLFLLWYLLSWALCAHLEHKIAPAFTVHKQMEKYGEGGGVGLAQRSVQLMSALFHHRTQYAGNHLCIYHEIPGRRDPKFELPHQASTGINRISHHKWRLTGIKKQEATWDWAWKGDGKLAPVTKLRPQGESHVLSASENSESQPVRQRPLSMQGQNKEYFPNCCGPRY